MFIAFNLAYIFCPVTTVIYLYSAVTEYLASVKSDKAATPFMCTDAGVGK